MSLTVLSNARGHSHHVRGEGALRLLPHSSPLQAAPPAAECAVLAPVRFHSLGTPLHPYGILPRQSRPTLPSA